MCKSKKSILKYFAVFIILGYILATEGCVTPMALNKRTKKLDLPQKSIVLMSVRGTNDFKPKNQLILENIYIKAKDNGKKFNFKVGRPINFIPFKIPKFYDHLISLKLPSNEYTIWRIAGKGQFMGGFYVDTEIDFFLEQNTVVYLGHMEMTNREKNEGEPSSGFVLPLIDQALGGFSGGTMDITVSDNYDEDIEIFKQHYPILDRYTVEKDVISPESFEY